MTDMRACYSTFLTALALVLLAGTGAADCLAPCESNLTMQNVLLIVSKDGVQMSIPTLTGKIVAQRIPASLDVREVLVQIDAAEIRFSSEALSALMTHVFATRGDLSNIAVTASPPYVTVSAKWHHFPVAFDGSLSAVDGAIHLRPRHLAGLYTNRIVWDGGEAHGVTTNADRDEIVLIPEKMIADYIQIRGSLTAVSISGDEIVETFGNPPPERAAGSLLRIDGGDVVVDATRTSEQPFVKTSEARLPFKFGAAR